MKITPKDVHIILEDEDYVYNMIIGTRIILCNGKIIWVKDISWYLYYPKFHVSLFAKSIPIEWEYYFNNFEMFKYNSGLVCFKGVPTKTLVNFINYCGGIVSKTIKFKLK